MNGLAVDTGLAGDLEYLLDVVHLADDTFRHLPASLREEIELSESGREVARLATHLADLSPSTRSWLEGLILRALELAGADPYRERPTAPVLRLVPGGAS